MSNTIRTFIAIPLAPEIQQTIGQIQNHLKTFDCNIKWVKPDNVHLTLKFLGDVKLKKIELIKQVLEDIFKVVKPLNIEFTQLGAFPDIKHPRILWVGLKDEGGRIAHLVSLLEDECGKIGFKKEEKLFSPHITIGRTRSPRNLNLLSEAIANYSMPNSLAQTDQPIILYKSILTAQGPIYETLYKIDFS